MPSIFLLNEDGTFHKKLQLVSLPGNYKVPEGKILSWRNKLSQSYNSYHFAWDLPHRPINAYFYLGSAWANVAVTYSDDLATRTASGYVYNLSYLTVTVQGTSASDLMTIREHILSLIENLKGWEVRNDLNPPPPKPESKFVRWMKHPFRKSN